MSRFYLRAVHRSAVLSCVGLVWGDLANPPVARADRIMLRGGGQIHGKLIADPADAAHLTFVGEVGKKPIIYRPEQIIQVISEKSALDEYVVRRGRERTLAEEEYQLGVWCSENKLRDLAENHFEAALRLDANYAPAHEKLGHTLLDDHWLDADALREAQGMVKYRGRWMLAEEKERLEDQASHAAESQSWVRRIRIYHDAYLAGQDNRAKDAESRLLAIREVAAVGPVARVLGADPSPIVRDLAARVLGAIPGPEASSALVARFLSETDGAVREATVAQLARRDAGEVVPRLVRALKSQQGEVVNRAAWALGRLNAVASVPQLISALVLVEYRTEMVPVGVGPGGGGIGASFSSVAPAGGVGFGNYTSSAYVVPTNPVVAPGAVAFSATPVPLVNGVALGNGGNVGGFNANGLSIGTGGVEPKYLPRIVPVDHPNIEVRNALTTLTGKDFGFDVAIWKRWASASFRSDKNPTRRVVQP